MTEDQLTAPTAGRSNFTGDEGRIEGSTKDGASVDRFWVPAQETIAGVRVKEVRNVLRRQGFLTEIFRSEWNLDDGSVDQVFQSLLPPGAVSAWHVHRHATDRIFVSWGVLKLVLYDARRLSPSYGLVNEFRFGSQRPALVVIPPGIWHGVKNESPEPSVLLNLVDRAYSYEDPDHWRLPPDTDKIPYAF